MEETNRDQAPRRLWPPLGPAEVVVTVHGIESLGLWQGSIHHQFTGIEGLHHYPHNYRRVRAWHLLRRRLVEALADDLAGLCREIQEDHNVPPSVIAHSLGTLILSRAIERHQLALASVVLCGSIVRRDFQWENHSIERIRNDIGKRDWVCGLFRFPPLRWWLRGTGSSGIDGFQSRKVDNRRFEEFDHSDFFRLATHCEVEWFPYIRGTGQFRDLCRGIQASDKAAEAAFDANYMPRIVGYMTLFSEMLHRATGEPLDETTLEDLIAVVRKAVIEVGAHGRRKAGEVIRKEAYLHLAVILEERQRSSKMKQ